MSINIDLIIDKCIFIDVIVTALEGGSNYWYILDTDELVGKLKHYKDSGLAVTEQIANELYSNECFAMHVYDCENDSERIGNVSYHSIRRAFQKVSKEYPDVFMRITCGQYDAFDADILFQIAALGGVFYG